MWLHIYCLEGVYLTSPFADMAGYKLDISLTTAFIKVESIMLQNLLIMLFANFLPIMLILCFLDIHYADNLYL